MPQPYPADTGAADRPSAGPPVVRTGCAPLRLDVDLDLASQERIRAELLAAVSRCPPGAALLVDAAAVFVDVCGTTMLLQVAAAARRAGKQLIVIAPRVLRRIHQVLELDSQLLLLDPAATTEPPCPLQSQTGQTASWN